jgi:hypothetical protein
LGFASEASARRFEDAERGGGIEKIPAESL